MGKDSRIRSALVVFKKSAWEQHVAGKREKAPLSRTFRNALMRAHDENARAIEAVRETLESLGIPHRVSSRADLHPSRVVNVEPDLVISVGGDGTFLEASHQVRRGKLLGVNSSPEHSVGFFCAATRQTFARVLARTLGGRMPITELTRLEIRLGRTRLPHLVLNDVLITHQNPGATSRYALRVGGREEIHRSSGMWIATAAGSTAGIRAAGGKLLPARSTRMQYAVRELYVPPGSKPFRLTTGTVDEGVEIRVESHMVEGALFIDGPRHRYPLSLGDVVTARVSKTPLNAVGFGATRGLVRD